MKLYDFMKLSQVDYDTYDTVYDACVTVCYLDEEDMEDSYDKFCIKLMKMVELEKVNGDDLLVKWTELITKNMDKFKAFTEKHWRYNYEDDEDEFIYQWINELHMYLAGYVSEDFYDTLLEFLESIKA